MKKLFRLLSSLILISSFSIYAQNVIQIEEGENMIDDALFEAQAGDIIELTTNGGIYYEFFSAIIDKPITIRAKEGLTTKPIIYTDDGRSIFTVRDDLTLQGVMLYGAGGNERTQCGIRTDSIDVKMGYNLTVDNCFFYDFNEDLDDPDGHALRGDPETQANRVELTNSIIILTGAEGIYYKNAEIAPGSVLDFYVENCTFWNTGAEAIYVEDHDNDISTDNGAFTVKNVNVHNATDKSIYPKELEENVLIQNFIVSNDEEDTSIDPCRIYSSASVAEYFLSFNIDSISLQNDAFVDPEKTLENVDPMYLDMAQGNFRLDPLSPAVGFGTEGKTLGDPRWWPSNPAKIEIDGLFGDWAGLEPLLVTENDPEISDSVDVKSVWIAVDDEKIAFRWDFFDNVNFASDETEGTYNRSQGWHRVYATAFTNEIDKYFRIRSYYGLVDTTTFSRVRWDVQSDSLGYDNDEFDGTRFTGGMAWSDDGTSMEMYVLLDSLFYLDEDSNKVAYITKDDSLEFYFKNTDLDVYLPPGPDGKLDPDHGLFKVALADYYIGGTSDPVGVRYNNSISEIPNNYSLNQNYPNPFNPLTNIEFSLPEKGLVSLKIYNLLGQEVISLINKEMVPGNHIVPLDASNLSSGIYFYTLSVNKFNSTKKMILLK